MKPMKHVEIVRNWIIFWLILGWVFVGATALNMVGCDTAHASVNMEAIKQIESGGNPKAFNKGSGARGLYQITPICLKHYNEVHGRKVGLDELFKPETNLTVATWYFSWLEGQGLDEGDQIIAYNWGIGNLMKYRAGVKDLPKETQDYLTKYQVLTNGE
jgi:soluble lytic murein transglycosylase-like protein